MNNKNIIFDWSGVVRDATLNQLWITNYIFGRLGISSITLEELRENWEQPYMLFYQKYIHTELSKEEQSKLYREAISHTDCPKSPAIAGMPELIRSLKDNGCFVAVVSSDPQETFLEDLKEFGLENIFDEIKINIYDKLESVIQIIKLRKLNRDHTYFVGDSNHEIEVAQKVGIKSVAVTWGFINKARLTTFYPDYIVDSVGELGKVMLQLNHE